MLQKLEPNLRDADQNKIIEAVNLLIEAENRRLERGAKMAAGRKKK